MATKKRYSDINKAIKEAEARREEYCITSRSVV